ncbi:FAD-dependent oxidoreductase [Helcobacillus sp. ACRRO]|uniref:protoporphyrinogen/coproporphyrinogen oxidase n=1 Tax=Helcobacillus sp. ACRRO TaxID=2918202 RepID=UPI001EF461AF|nr:FAD-dependent oxidoreductase [Helcobacillus sp. ACRRO]
MTATATRTLVIGGGFAGLLAALRAAQAGEQVTLVEADSVTGGVIRSAVVDGLDLNAGPEAYASRGGRVQALVEELGLADRVVEPAGSSSFIVLDDHAFASPSRAVMGLPAQPLSAESRRALGLVGSLRAAAERLLPASYGWRDGISIGELTRRRFGRRVLDRLVAPLITGVHSADPMALELETVLPSLRRRADQAGSVQQAVAGMLAERDAAQRGRAASARPTAAAGRSGAPVRAGAAVRAVTPTMAAIPEAMAERIRELGGTVLTSTRAVSIDADGTAWTVTLEPAGSDIPAGGPDTGAAAEATASAPTAITADRLVIATDPDTTRDLLRGLDTDPAQASLADLVPASRPVPVRLCTLVLQAPALSRHPRGNGALVAPSATTITAKAMTHASAKWDHVRTAARTDEHPHRHVIRLSYGRGDEPLPDRDRFPDLALRDAARILGVEGAGLSLVDWALTDITRTQRRAAAGHSDAVAALRSALPATIELSGAWIDGTGLEAITRERDTRS